MGKKKNKNSQPQPQHRDDCNGGGEEEAEQNDSGQGGGDINEGKNNNNNNNNNNGGIILKIEMHCDGCASRILKVARSFQGVENVKVDSESNKLTVTGKVNPTQIRDFLQQKTKKKVDLISPQPKKEDSNKKSDEKKPEKPKEAGVTTAVIKLSFHCLGCIEKINKIVSKTKGLHEMSMDKQKETVTVKGTMDVKALTAALKDRLKREVEIVPPKKEGGGGDGDKGGSGDGGKKKNGGGGGQDNAGGGGGGGGKMEGNRMEYVMQPGFGYGFGPGPGYGHMGQPMPPYGHMRQPMPMPMPVYGNGYPGMAPPPPGYGSGYGYGYGYGYGQVEGYPLELKFNDENSDSCAVM
ncbi:Heavy metal transport/detoxification superfamily protein [Euphorbia peplus]|nr:Heavy metal transport/detoxification superfamily protein [Euphorbia peplus]